MHKITPTELQPQFSIVVSAYNKHKSIRSTLRSLTSQTCRDIEVIVVDDASSDTTPSIVEDISRTNRNVRLVRHPQNLGLSATRITGLAQAKGEWVLFVDAGDRLAPRTCQHLSKTVATHDVQVVFMGMKIETKHLHLRRDYWIANRIFDHKILPANDLLPYILRKSNVPCSIVNRAYRRDFLQSLKLKPYRNFYGEDLILSANILTHNPLCVGLDYQAYIWVMGGGSHSPFDAQWQREKILSEDLLSLLENIDCADSKLKIYAAEGVCNSFVHQLSRYFSSPFGRNIDIENYVRQQMSDPLWHHVARYIDISDFRPIDLARAKAKSMWLVLWYNRIIGI